MTIRTALIAGATAAGLAAVINAVLYFALGAGMGFIPDTVLAGPPDNPQPITIVPVLMASIIPSLVGALACWLLLRFKPDGFGIFRIISIVLLLLSFLNPVFMIQGAPVAMIITLNLMHCVVAGALLWSLQRSLTTGATA
ncbi:MAG: hypothetical protein JNL32_04365 [Candidatus Kapabacteria bacterium]|nr:hypothetical protein [Candidatus Kapabacteria bacterium]